jgi:energy-converting hydrogenase Eha subunit F
MKNLMQVYKGRDNNKLYTSSFDGTTWYGDIPISAQLGGIAPMSNYNPGTAVLNDKLYIIYKGWDSNVLFTAWFDGTVWHGNTPISSQPGGINPESNYCPNIAAYKGKLYTVYKGWNNNELYAAWFDGTTWHGNTRISSQPGGINPMSNHNPGLAVLGDKLYIVYKGWNNNELYTTWFDGNTWHGNTRISSQPGGINPESNYCPNIVAYKNRLYIVYKGWNNNELYTAWFDGTTWHGNTRISTQSGGINPMSNYNPGVAVLNDKLYIVYKGWNNDTLYTAWFDGTTWHGNTPISNQPGGISPQSNYNPGISVSPGDLDYGLSDWMKKLSDDLRLDKIMMPGSHDAGMSELHHCAPPLGAEGRTKTQSLDIGQQLANGSRYFDIRVDYDYDTLVTYHRTGPFGCNGQSLEPALDQVKQFLATHRTETAILKFSHIRDYIGHDPDTTKLKIDSLLNKYNSILYKNDSETVNLAEIPLRNARGKMIVVFDYDECVHPSAGRFRYKDGSAAQADANIVVFDEYADKEDYDEMKADQIRKWRDHGGLGKGFLFLLSWTLTPGAGSTVEELAAIANDKLPGVLHQQIVTSSFSKPNIVYIDYVNRDTAFSIVQYNFWHPSASG